MADEFIFDENENQFYLPDKSMTYAEYFNTLQKDDLNKVITYKDDIQIYFSINSKFIKFIVGEKELNIFIVNSGQIYFLIDYFGFTKYIVLKNEIEIDNVLYSLDFDTVKKVDNYLKEEDYKKANKKLDNSNIPLQSLSILYDKYQKYDTPLDKFLLTKERKEFFQKLNDLLGKTNFVSICGPKSIGKTTSLLYFKKNYIKSSFYINLSYCKKLYESKETEEELYLTICKELFCCLNFEEVNKVYSFLEKNDYNSLMDLLYKLINYFSENFKKKHYFIIIDQYKEKIDKDNIIIEEIKNFSKKKNISIIICNSLNEKDYRKALHLYKTNPNKFFLNYLFINKLVTISEEEEAQLNDEEKQLLFQCGKLFQYFYKIIKNRGLKNIEEIKGDIINEIKDEINKYYEKNKGSEIIGKIREIHSILNKNIPYEKLFNVLNFIPLKYFVISIDSKNSFLITDIKEGANISIEFSFPIVIESINDILYDNKKIEKNNLINNISNQKSFIDVEKEFNEFLWISRFNYFYKESKIQEKIKISAIIKMNDEDLKIYKSALKLITKKNYAILITQTEQNAQYFDTAILKYVDKGKYELYLFQETSKKEKEERLCTILLTTLKHYLILLFKVNLKINIEEVYFSYVFNGEEPDQTTINYCDSNQINYILFFENKRMLKISDINDKIVPSFFYLQNPKNMIKRGIELTVLNIGKKKAKDIREEFDKLNEFLQKKRENKKKAIDKLKTKIKDVMSYDKVSFRENNYTELLLDEELMEKENPIIGISYKIDAKTKNLLKLINFTNQELKNLFELVKEFGDNLSILKVIEINDFALNWIPSFRCAIVAVDGVNKIYYDIKENVSYKLSTNTKIKILNVMNTNFYMIIFTNSKMIKE